MNDEINNAINGTANGAASGIACIITGILGLAWAVLSLPVTILRLAFGPVKDFITGGCQAVRGNGNP